MPADLNGKNVLVADDDPEILATLRAAFEASGAKVTTVNDGNKALDFAKRINPDLLILDMMMPRRSGFLVLETLKPEKQSGVKPFVIMITANEGKRHELYAKHLGVDDYISKPFSVERLLESACRLTGGKYIDPDESVGLTGFSNSR
ncbi:MAG TPA: response regulator [Phycisphaerae bacterium]|nr:response regulator [Phycisphaerae bacterium]